MQEEIMHLPLPELNVSISYIYKKIPGAPSPVLVFLHEGLGSIGQWKDFPFQIQQHIGLPVLIYDRAGHGQASPLFEPRSASYLHDEALKVLPSIIKKLAIPDVILIGHSDGGSIALIYASMYPEKTKAVITEAAHVFVEDVSIQGIEKAVKHYESQIKLRTGLKKYHGEKTDSLFYAWADTWLSPEFREWNIEGHLPSILAPVLAIQGVEDEYGTESQVEKIIGGVAGPAEKLMLPGCGHSPHHQQKNIVIGAVTEFILKHERSGTN